ncbi:MAG: histidine kinase [Synechococcales cyanobacterium RU_4_20]|nr:histidine kinase [Synechococcales cyanobacterium RU_4_20]
MDAEKQRVLGFFIEGAREHLDTIERGLLNLQAALADPEQVNELFRAAHSVKGDAAMLNLTSIHKVAHRLEDCFKLLQDKPIRVDQQVESLFLRGFDSLHELLEKLQGPSGLAEADAQLTVQEVEPVFTQLQDYLLQLSGGGGTIPPRFAAQVNATLKQMLQLFRQPDGDEGRKKLQAYCGQLAKLDPGVEAWPLLLQMTQKAMGDRKITYRELAPVVIKEIKEASNLIVANQGHVLVPSAALRRLAGPVAPVEVIQPPQAAPSDKLVLPEDPKAIAKLLIETLDRKKLVQLAQFLVRYLKGS